MADPRPLRRFWAVGFGGFAVLCVAALFVDSQLASKPAAVLLVERPSSDRLTLTYWAKSAQSIVLVENTAGGTRNTIPTVLSDAPQIVHRGPWSSGAARPVGYELVARARFGREARDTAVVGTAAQQQSPGPVSTGDADPVGAVRAYY